MEDSEILALFFVRDEKAIDESERKYGALCRSVAGRILDSPQDTEECVSDTWLRAWNAIPPERPGRLDVYFTKITRNLALDRWRSSRTKKKGGGELDLCLDELKNTLSDADADPADRLVLRELLNRFLRGLSAEAREIFLLRYWYFCPNDEIARRTGKSTVAVKVSLHRTREKLRNYLEKEGFDL